MIVIGDHLPFIADEDARSIAEAKARKLFSTDEMAAAGVFMARVHCRALDYLEQAPILAIFVRNGGGKLHGGLGGAEIYAAHKIGGLCERGARLRDVMAAYGLPLPMRALRGKALGYRDLPALQLLSGFSPAVLGNIIPRSVAAQRRWLSTLRQWCRLNSIHSTERGRAASGWFAEVASVEGLRAGEIGDVLDFIRRGDVPLNPRWTWRRAQAAMADWHDRVSAGDARKKFGIMVDQQIDFGGHPETDLVGGYEFVALRTPMAIHAEGTAMRHCVSTYVRDVVDGRCHIVSIRHDEGRIATLEIRLPGFVVGQVKGRMNSAPDGDVMTAARRYVFEQRRIRKIAP